MQIQDLRNLFSGVGECIRKGITDIVNAKGVSSKINQFGWLKFNISKYLNKSKNLRTTSQIDEETKEKLELLKNQKQVSVESCDDFTLPSQKDINPHSNPQVKEKTENVNTYVNTYQNSWIKTRFYETDEKTFIRGLKHILAKEGEEDISEVIKNFLLTTEESTHKKTVSECPSPEQSTHTLVEVFSNKPSENLLNILTFYFGEDGIISVQNLDTKQKEALQKALGDIYNNDIRPDITKPNSLQQYAQQWKNKAHLLGLKYALDVALGSKTKESIEKEIIMISRGFDTKMFPLVRYGLLSTVKAAYNALVPADQRIE